MLSMSPTVLRSQSIGSFSLELILCLKYHPVVFCIQRDSLKAVFFSSFCDNSLVFTRFASLIPETPTFTIFRIYIYLTPVSLIEEVIEEKKGGIRKILIQKIETKVIVEKATKKIVESRHTYHFEENENIQEKLENKEWIRNTAQRELYKIEEKMKETLKQEEYKTRN